MDVLFSGVIAVVVLYLLVKFFVLPFKLVWNGICGVVILWLANLLGGIIGLHLNVTIISALIAGFFGIPGVFCLIAYQLLGK